MSRFGVATGAGLSLSFIDCIASALGAIMILVFVLASVREHGAELDARHRTLVTVTVERAPSDSPSPAPATRTAPAMPCQVRFFVKHVPASWEADQRRGQPYRPVTGPGRDVDLFANDQAGASVLQLLRRQPGVWQIWVMLEPREKSLARVAVRAQIGREDIRTFGTADLDLTNGPTVLRFDAPGFRGATVAEEDGALRLFVGSSQRDDR
jgi:hypothetical protein